ncbi:MAG TPA: class I tRNA ligase family protein, partial [Flavipsychrobacter sp.]|nr:class I tRNA ligase family protein [Flavipsychrobacter sp.]
YSPAAGTGLSSHELNQPGTYKNVKDTTVVAMFKAIDTTIFPSQITTPIYYLAWTTTPWTLPSNCGLTVGPKIDYVLVKTFNPYTQDVIHVIIAKALVGKYFKPENENADFATYASDGKNLPWETIATYKGTELENLRYEQLLPFEANNQAATNGNPWRVVWRFCYHRRRNWYRSYGSCLWCR